MEIFIVMIVKNLWRLINKMQEYCYDYSDDEEGCCLNCEYAKPGCLCYQCRCTKCFHYSSPEDSDDIKGSCDIATSRHIRNREIRKKISKCFSKDYSKLGLKKGQTQLNSTQ